MDPQAQAALTSSSAFMTTMTSMGPPPVPVRRNNRNPKKRSVPFEDRRLSKIYNNGLFLPKDFDMSSFERIETRDNGVPEWEQPFDYQVYMNILTSVRFEPDIECEPAPFEFIGLKILEPAAAAISHIENADFGVDFHALFNNNDRNSNRYHCNNVINNSVNNTVNDTVPDTATIHDNITNSNDIVNRNGSTNGKQDGKDSASLDGSDDQRDNTAVITYDPEESLIVALVRDPERVLTDKNGNRMTISQAMLAREDQRHREYMAAQRKAKKLAQKQYAAEQRKLQKEMVKKPPSAPAVLPVSPISLPRYSHCSPQVRRCVSL